MPARWSYRSSWVVCAIAALAAAFTSPTALASDPQWIGDSIMTSCHHWVWEESTGASTREPAQLARCILTSLSASPTGVDGRTARFSALPRATLCMRASRRRNNFVMQVAVGSSNSAPGRCSTTGSVLTPWSAIRARCPSGRFLRVRGAVVVVSVAPEAFSCASLAPSSAGGDARGDQNRLPPGR